MKYEIKQQLSIVIPNQPGQIARVCQVLLAHKISLTGIMFVDTVQQGVVRFVMAEAVRAQQALEAQGFFVVLADVLEVELSNRPGALCGLAQAMGEAGVNIDYAYGTDNPSPGHARLVLKVSSMNKGIEVLKTLEG